MKQRTLALCLALVMAFVFVGCNGANTVTLTDVTGTDVSKLDTNTGETANGTSADNAESTVGESQNPNNATVSQAATATGSSSGIASQVNKPSNLTTTKPNNTVTSKPSSNNSQSSEDEVVFKKFDADKVEQLVAKYINEYRVAEGKPAATFLFGKAHDYVKIRAKQLTTNFRHDPKDEHDAAQQAKFGELSTIEDCYYDIEKDEVIYTGKTITSYAPIGGEAICRQDADVITCFTNDEIAKRIATAYYKSPNHWSYLGHENNLFITVGLAIGNGYLCDCVYVNKTNEYD